MTKDIISLMPSVLMAIPCCWAIPITEQRTQSHWMSFSYKQVTFGPHRVPINIIGFRTATGTMNSACLQMDSTSCYPSNRTPPMACERYMFLVAYRTRYYSVQKTLVGGKQCCNRNESFPCRRRTKHCISPPTDGGYGGYDIYKDQKAG